MNLLLLIDGLFVERICQYITKHGVIESGAVTRFQRGAVQATVKS